MSAADRLAALGRQLLRLEAQRDGLNAEYQSIREHFESLRGVVMTPRVWSVAATLDEVVRTLGDPQGPAKDRGILEQEVDRRALAAAIAARDDMKRVMSMIEETRAELAALSTLVKRCREYLATQGVEA